MQTDLPAKNSLEEERSITIHNMSNDTARIYNSLMAITNLTPEGEIIRDDLIGLLLFDTKDQVDTLMIERRKIERNTFEFNQHTEKRVLQ